MLLQHLFHFIAHETTPLRNLFPLKRFLRPKFPKIDENRHFPAKIAK